MIKLVLFFTRGVSLQTWDRTGMFDREVALYRRLQEHDVDISFVTYGNATDLEYATHLPGIHILCNRWNLPGRFYERLVPWLHARRLHEAHVFKTNQMNGADVAQNAAKTWNKSLIARCGYMWSDLAASGGLSRRTEYEIARRIEQTVFSSAQGIVVTTAAMRDYVVTNYGIKTDAISIIPNYVLSDLFSPGECSAYSSNKLCFVGRLSAEKNPLALVEACGGLGVNLVMVGEGPLRSRILETASQHSTTIQLLGSLPHIQLPDFLRSCRLFLLVSPHEGHPKTLIEAMSCGLPVIGADTPGIRDVIKHGETGWLCGTDAESIRQAILHLLDDPELCARLGKNARQYVLDNFALDRIVALELQILKKAAGGMG